MMIGRVQIPSGTAPEFGLLYDIILHGEEQCILFIFISMETIQYNPVLGAYELLPLSQYRCLYRTSIECYYPFNPIHDVGSTKIFIRSKYDLTVYCNYYPDDDL